MEELALTTPSIGEAVVRKTADALISPGTQVAGYWYLVIDDGWLAMERDSITGELIPDQKSFQMALKK